jgi:hypothetical protein
LGQTTTPYADLFFICFATLFCVADVSSFLVHPADARAGAEDWAEVDAVPAIWRDSNRKSSSQGDKGSDKLRPGGDRARVPFFSRDPSITHFNPRITERLRRFRTRHSETNRISTRLSSAETIRPSMASE